MSLAIRSLARATPRAAVRSAGAAPSSSAALRLAAASTSSSAQDPKSRAASIIDALPGSGPIQKTSYITLGTGLTAAAISSELFVINEEVIVLGSFAILATVIASAVRTPYADWADSQIEVSAGYRCHILFHGLQTPSALRR